MKSAFKKSKIRYQAGAALRALTLVGVGAVGSLAVTPAAVAQNYTSGAITGTVTDDAGGIVQGAVITVTSPETGQTRSATSTATGGFRFSNLTTGNYNVEVESGGEVVYRAEGVRVVAGQTTNLIVEAATSAGDVIVVTGSAIRSDFTGTTTGLSVDIDELIKTTPISRDLTSVVLLSPGTSGGDSAFGNLASIGGSSVAENAYYVNGLNTTNFDNYLGSARVPFDFYRTIEVKTGGYPAEFGRATGGIVSATTKSGSNDFKAAAHVYWQPEFLSTPGNNLLSCDASGICDRRTNRAYDESNSLTTVIEAGGPIIRDRLFAYGILEMRDITSRTISRSAERSFESTIKDPFYGIKIDAYPIDNHHFEFTLFDSSSTTVRNDRAYSEDANGIPQIGVARSVNEFNSGGVSYVAQYTGRFTDFLTVSGAYGRARDRFDNVGTAGDAALPAVRQQATLGSLGGVPYLGYFNGQTVASTTNPYRTEREFYRADVDLYVSLLGDHHFRAGFDQENNTLSKASVRNGGQFLLDNNFITDEAASANFGGAGIYYIVRPGGVVELNYFNSAGNFDATNRAFYLQDEWTVNDRLTLNLGVRRDDFKVFRPDGVEIVNLDKNYAPRLGFTYNVGKDYQGKFYGAYSEYYLPFASNTAFRTTGSEYFIRERFNYSGFDGNGIPILGSQITNRADYQATCPFGLTPVSSGQFCNVTGDGSVSSADTLISQNLKATKESEWIVGYDHTFGDWTVGLNYTRRRLLNTAEDAAIDAAVLQYCEDNGIAGCENTFTGFHQYVILNPGKEATILLDGADNSVVTFTPEQLGYPEAVRKYDAVEFTFSRPWNGDWTLNGSYTWSKSRGNSEGFVQSDFGQADAGITQDFDQPTFTEFAYGRLPNDRRHRFKLFGAVALNDSFTLGTTIKVDSPRPLSCFGYHPTDPFAQAYGAASHYCLGQPAPRGEGLESDWIGQFDVNFSYNLTLPTGQGLRLTADVFNLFNSQGISERDEIGELDLNVASANYGQPTNYQTPRYVRLSGHITF